MDYTGTLVVITCWCGMAHAVPSELRAHQEAEHRGGRPQTAIYCPLGHSHIIAGKGEAERLRADLDRYKDRNAALVAERDQVVASLRTTKGVVTKMRKRAIVGACQFCHRTFANVARHVATVHPTETPE
jgi:hypothetical protein